MLAIIVGVAMMVGAVSMCLSNVVENNNTVGLPITISILPATTTAALGGDLPNYASGHVALGQKFDMLVSFTTTEVIDYVSIIVEFSKVDINVTDVDMGWATTDALTWATISWTDSGDVLRGTLGIAGGQPADTTGNYYAYLCYTATGSFTFKM